MAKTLEVFLSKCRFAFDGFSQQDALKYKSKVKESGAAVEYLITKKVVTNDTHAYVTDFFLGYHTSGL